MVDCLGEVKTSYRYAAPGRYIGQPSLISQPHLCEECNKNQAAKIQELNSFEPTKESDFHSELEAHKQQLNDRYKLCHSCHNTVKHHLNVQAMDLKTFLLGSHLQQSKSTPTKLLQRSSSSESISLVLARLTCILLTSLLLCSDSLSCDSNTCDKVHSLWNTSYFDWSNITKAGFTRALKHLLLHVTRSFGFTMSSSWQSGLDFIVCLCCLAKMHYLGVSLVCLLINILMFLKRKNRFGILILFSWTLLSSLRYWEVFWLKSDCGWRVTAAAFCWLLGACSFLFSLLLYSRVLGTKKKKSYRSQLISRQPSSTEKRHASDSEILDTTNESEPSRDKTAAELDHNLNGLTLGLPTGRRRNGYKTHLSPRNSGTTGSFWNQSVHSNSKESPLVSMRQRPLIVPATLHFSGLQQGRCPASHTREATNGNSLTIARGQSSNSYGISDDDFSSSDAIDEESSMQNSSIHKDTGTKPKKTKRRIPARSSKTGLTGFPSLKTFLLLASILLNVYFTVLFTEWPVRILHSLWKSFQR